MPGITINEQLGINEGVGVDHQEDMMQYDLNSVENTQTNQLFEMLKQETGAGELDEYKNHPLNYNNSNGMARIIRGLSGMFGSLNYAVLDVVLGIMEITKGKGLKGGNSTDL